MRSSIRRRQGAVMAGFVQIIEFRTSPVFRTLNVLREDTAETAENS